MSTPLMPLEIIEEIQSDFASHYDYVLDMKRTGVGTNAAEVEKDLSKYLAHLSEMAEVTDHFYDDRINSPDWQNHPHPAIALTAQHIANKSTDHNSLWQKLAARFHINEAV